MSEISVKVFRSTDTGAPTLSGTAGTLINVLNACLNTGYGSITLDSLVVTSNTVTGTKSTGHGFTLVGTVGPVIRIAGATPSGLNGDWRIAIPDSTHFTFTTSGIADQTATGTITAIRCPLDFNIPYTGTNLAAYRSTNVQGTQLYLRIDDSPNYSANADMYENMTDINTGTGRFNTASFGWCRSYYTTSTACPWIIVGDSRLFFMHVNHMHDNNCFTLQSFGDAGSYIVGDAYKNILTAGVRGAGGVQPVYGINGQNSWLYDAGGALTGYQRYARNYLQAAGGVTFGVISNRLLNSAVANGSGNSSIVNPDPVSGATAIFAQMDLIESTSILRGWMPGLYSIVTNIADVSRHGTVVTETSGRNMLILGGQAGTGAATGGIGVDITGPWIH